MKKYPFRKAKNAFVYNIKSTKFYDFKDNSNILGHSNKGLTTIVKNNISSSWNISGKTIYHERLKKLLKKDFSNNFYSAALFSIEEFFLRFFNNYKDYEIINHGQRFNIWLNEKNIHPLNNSTIKKTIDIYDIAEIYLKSNGDDILFKNGINNINKNDLLIFNYFWFPDLKIITGNADIIVLPQIYCGNFNYVLILIKNNIKNIFCNELESVPSLYISSSLKNYYMIKKQMLKTNNILLNWNDFIQSGRIFSLKNIDEINEKYLKLESKNILINNKPPYYSYLPIILEEYQQKYLNKVF